jgi:hypothetical protein
MAAMNENSLTMFTWSERELEGRWNVMTNQVMMPSTPLQVLAFTLRVKPFVKPIVSCSITPVYFFLQDTNAPDNSPFAV